MRTLKKAPGPGHGIAIAETLDDRYIAVVGGGRHPNSPLSRYEFWDMVRDKRLFHMDNVEPILGIRVNFDYVAVIYIDCAMIFKWSKSSEDGVTAIPAKPHNIYKTASNPHALCCISDHIMVLPGLTPGQVQILGLVDNSKRIIPAHQTALRAISLSRDGDLLATTSQQVSHSPFIGSQNSVNILGYPYSRIFNQDKHANSRVSTWSRSCTNLWLGHLPYQTIHRIDLG